MKQWWVRLLGSLTISCILLARSSAADCECGYSITAGDDRSVNTFTDLLESDFIHVDYVSAASNQKKGWAVQVFNKSAERARGSYGESFIAGNLEGNVIHDTNIWTSNGAGGRDAGLELVVDSNVVDKMVQAGQVATMTGDYFHGSYRASIKVTVAEGTCTAFFWVSRPGKCTVWERGGRLTERQYFNDTQEIDIEFLSEQFSHSNSSYSVNLVLQTPQSEAANYDASKTGAFLKVDLPFDPTEDFHEYRFDFFASRVLFYADSTLLAAMNGSTGGVPTTSGNLILSHWSNGNVNWSGGPPRVDAVSVVKYVKAYYNSSAEVRRGDFERRCTDPAKQGAVCEVPEGNATFFFMYQSNMTANQSTYGTGGGDSSGDENGTADTKTTVESPMALYIALVAALWVCGL